MRILMTADTMGGVWTYAMDLCGELSRRGVAVALVTMGRPMNAAQRSAADDIPGLCVVETAYKLEWMQDAWDDVARAGDVLWRVAEDFEPDVVHLNGFVHASLPWEAPALVVGHSCVETWWRAVKGERTGAEWTRYRGAVRQGIEDADRFVAPTRAMLDAFAAAYGPHRNAGVIPNGRAATFYAPRDKEPMVLAAGRVWDEAKNIALLDAAAPAIDAPVFVAGDGTSPDGRSHPDLNARALGPLPPRELAGWMGRAAVYALPAKYEPFGLSALEAALCGCALVLGDIPTLREVWGDAAVYVDPDDAAALAAACNRLLRDDEHRRSLAARAHRRAARYSVAAMAEAYLDDYRALVRDHRFDRSPQSGPSSRKESAACAS